MTFELFQVILINLTTKMKRVNVIWTPLPASVSSQGTEPLELLALDRLLVTACSTAISSDVELRKKESNGWNVKLDRMRPTVL